MQLSALEAEQTGRPAGKDSSVRGFAQAKEGDIGQMKRLVNTLELLAMAPEQSAIGARPDVARAILQNSADELVGQPSLGPKD